MRTILTLTVFILGAFAVAPAAFAFSGPFVPLSSEQIDDVRDPDQLENERDVADSDNEPSTTSATQTDDQN